MAYDLSEEELLQLIGLKAGALSDAIGVVLESNEQLKPDIAGIVYSLSQEINNLAIELKKKVDLRDDPIRNTWRQ